MSLREQIHAAVRQGDLAEVERLAVDARALRHLSGLTYHADDDLRETAARGVGMVARHHPGKVQELARRLVWAMNDESGTNAATAPQVLVAIAREHPHLLLPIVPDLRRIAADDEGLRAGLVETLRLVTGNGGAS